MGMARECFQRRSNSKRQAMPCPKGRSGTHPGARPRGEPTRRRGARGSKLDGALRKLRARAGARPKSKLDNVGDALTGSVPNPTVGLLRDPRATNRRGKDLPTVKVPSGKSNSAKSMRDPCGQASRTLTDVPLSWRRSVPISGWEPDGTGNNVSGAEVSNDGEMSTACRKLTSFAEHPDTKPSSVFPRVASKPHGCQLGKA